MTAVVIFLCGILGAIIGFKTYFDRQVAGVKTDGIAQGQLIEKLDTIDRGVTGLNSKFDSQNVQINEMNNEIVKLRCDVDSAHLRLDEINAPKSR